MNRRQVEKEQLKESRKNASKMIVEDILSETKSKFKSFEIARLERAAYAALYKLDVTEEPCYAWETILLNYDPAYEAVRKILKKIK